VQGASSHVDVTVRKQCVSSLSRMVQAWAADVSFRHFAINSIGVQCCIQGLTDGGVDIRDGSVLGLLNEVRSMLILFIFHGLHAGITVQCQRSHD
jgi:hypothetical protein